ncbi:MAG: ABC-2 family transporter protein [Rickettsiales bacterium]|jgi:ABC-2 type transport system permease protein|nr:ABC-2 family transporter protein [Rickettsiales bacterium]
MGQIENPAMIVLCLCFMTTLVFVTEKLWQAIGHRGFDPVNIVWYLVMNEMLFFSFDERIQKRITNDIRSGNIGYSLLRPFSYLEQHVVESIGVFCARLPFLLLGSSALAFVITGALPTTFYGIIAVFILMPLSGLFTSLCMISIGLLGLYMQSTNSIFSLWQKFMFVLGGLFYPLTIYPPWLRNLSMLTPFPHGLYEISRLIYEFSWTIMLNTTVHLLGWIVVASFVSRWLYSELLKKVSINGG